MTPFSSVGLAISLALLTGCGSAPIRPATLSPTADCGEIAPGTLARSLAELDARADMPVLECALYRIRRAEAGFPHRGAGPARVCALLADMTPDPTRRVRIATEGVRWAEYALAHRPSEEGATRYYLAVNLGIAVRDDTARALTSLDRLIAELDAATASAADESDGGPLRVLGMLYLMAPSWPHGPGDGDRALALLGRAAESYPRHPLNHLFLARAIWEVEDDDRRARHHLAVAGRRLDAADWGAATSRWRAGLDALRDELEGE